MAITLPAWYQFTQENLSATYNESITEDRVLALRDNNHYLYAKGSLKNAVGTYWANGLLTSATSAEQVLEFPFTFSPGRNATGLRLIWRRTGTCTLRVDVRDAADTSTLASLGPSTAGAGESTGTITSGITDQEVLIKVYLTVSSGSAGLQYLTVSEIGLDLTNLP